MIEAKRGKQNPWITGTATLLGLPLALASSWIIYSNLAIDRDLALPDAIPAGRSDFTASDGHRLSYYHDRQAEGRPLVLIHSVNAAASSYEMRPLFLYYRSQRPVFALDLPGYGFSERTDRAYSPMVFAEAIVDLLTTQVGEAADVVALSLGGEFAARAARARPDLFHSLVLISPTGFSRSKEGDVSRRTGSKNSGASFFSLLSFPLWRRPFFDLLTTRRSIRYFLRQSFAGPVDSGLVDYAYLTSHQPGAEHVPLYFVSGQLFTPDAFETIYERVDVPTLVIYDQDAFVSFDRLPDLLQKKPNWQAQRITPTRGLPHFEKLPEVTEALNHFWRRK
ncbi:MAG TPA: alpha/beta fold hydrolase [Anaerolineae bacterium]